jgi:predicted kinase
MGKIIVLVGLPASGKSTLARELADKETAIIVSSDNLRSTMFGDINDQSHNTEVFEEMNRLTTQYIKEGYNVIYDATNLSRKRRTHLINQTAKNADEKVAYYLHTTLEEAIGRDENRERTVGAEVIKKMYKNLQIPLYGEGWDIIKTNITLYPRNREGRLAAEKVLYAGPSHDDLFDYLAEHVAKEFDFIFNLPHDSSYHRFSVSRHTYWVYRWILDNYEGADKEILLWAAVFHDIGKYHCKSFINHRGEEQKHANFIGHEYVSSQIALTALTNLGYDARTIQAVCDLIQTHMMLYNDGGLSKVKKFIGEDLAEYLVLLNTADRAAH